jgi:hypothetical protein
LAATQPTGSDDDKDIVRSRHVERAAELLFGSASIKDTATAGNGVFISYSHDDRAFSKN